VSGGALKSLMGLDIRDYFESIIDSRDFRSYRYRHQARQGRRKRDLEVTIDYQERRLSIQEYDAGVEPRRQIRTQRRSGIPVPLTDTLSVFYAVRLREVKPGEQYLIYLSDNGKIKEVQLNIVKRQEVSIALGKFDTVKISTVGSFFKGAGDFHVWYSRDDLRIPVKFEADVRFGKVYGNLIRLQTPHLIKGRVRTR
jgi:hypothetical protein